ncbi:MAG: LysR family transcriptional regulator [Thermomicrobiales bacterium]
MDAFDLPINLNRLRLFLAVVEHGGVRRAAEAIGISQPAVSQAIHALEAEVGLSLLERVGRGVRPTTAGLTLVEHGRRVMTEAIATRDAIDGLKGLARGSLALGASTTLGIYVLPDPLGVFHQRYPAIDLSLNVANTRDILTLLRDGRLDLAFVEGSVRDDDLEATSFLADELIAIVPPDSDLAQRDALTAQDLAGAPFLMREEGSGTREVVDRAFAAWGIAANVMMELGHTEAIKNAVSAGLGISILSQLTVAREIADGRLATRPIAMGSVTRPFLTVQRRSSRLSPASRAFLDIMRGAISLAASSSDLGEPQGFVLRTTGLHAPSRS